MNIYSIGSGSRGNCTLIESDVNILIDVGLSVKKINERLIMSSGIDLEDIKYVLITHSHIDHLSAVKTIYNKYAHILFYCSPITFDEIEAHFKMKFNKERFILSTVETYHDNITITPFPLNHDKESQGYMIKDKETYVHISDFGGWLNKELYTTLQGKTYYNIESNHSIDLTYFDEKRSPILKKRCLGMMGHCSNISSMENVCRLVDENTKGVMFNHLSEETNSEELAKKYHMKYLEVWNKLDLTKEIKFSYAKQNEIVFMDSGKTHKEIRGVR